MKIVAVILFLFGLHQAPLSDLYGKWKLEKIEKCGQTIKPNKVSYFLIIDKETIKYNLDVNWCGPAEFKIESDTIEFMMGGCTKICCDGREDTLYKYLNYTGKYSIIDSLLTIENKDGKFYLIKEK